MWTLITMLIGATVMLGLYGLSSRVIHGVWSAIHPLADGEPPIAEIDRALLWTADGDGHPVLGLLAGMSALAMLAAATSWSWVWLASGGLLMGALVLELRLWQRLVLSGSAVWRQEGLRGRVQRWPVTQIADVQVDEIGGGGWTWRGPRPSPVARLVITRRDGERIEALLTDAQRGHVAMEDWANQLRQRLAQAAASERHDAAWASADAMAGAARRAHGPGQLSQTDIPSAAERVAAEERLALRRRREQGLAPDDKPILGRRPPPGTPPA